jgi:hypothetical protein
VVVVVRRHDDVAVALDPATGGETESSTLESSRRGGVICNGCGNTASGRRARGRGLVIAGWRAVVA